MICDCLVYRVVLMLYHRPRPEDSTKRLDKSTPTNISHVCCMTSEYKCCVYLPDRGKEADELRYRETYDVSQWYHLERNPTNIIIAIVLSQCCCRSSSLPFPWYIRPQHFPRYVFAISPHHMPVPVQSSLGDVLEACATLVVPRMCSFLILSLRVTPHIHRSILISVTSIRFFLYLRCSTRFCPI